MQFKIEQIALHPKSVPAAMELLAAMGLAEWAYDHVHAVGHVFGDLGANEADLAFNYEASPAKTLELEVLHYTRGPNWMVNEARSAVSHIGMHVTIAELEEWRRFFAGRSIQVAQSVETVSHDNPVIAGKRCYTYVIFDTREILGADVKFIVRKNYEVAAK